MFGKYTLLFSVIGDSLYGLPFSSFAEAGVSVSSFMEFCQFRVLATPLWFGKKTITRTEDGSLGTARDGPFRQRFVTVRGGEYTLDTLDRTLAVFHRVYV